MGASKVSLRYAVRIGINNRLIFHVLKILLKYHRKSKYKNQLMSEISFMHYTTRENYRLVTLFVKHTNKQFKISKYLTTVNS